MNAAEIVVHVVDRQRRNMVLDLLRESIGQPCVSAHVHTHCEVLTLHVRRTDVLGVRVADLGPLLAANALGRRIA